MTHIKVSSKVVRKLLKCLNIHKAILDQTRFQPYSYMILLTS
jgi:hypothetical protein